MRPVSPPHIGVITLVSGRREHLVNQHRGLGASTTAPQRYVVVAIDEPLAASWLGADGLGADRPVADVVHLAADGGLPLAAARNLGARRAIEGGADILVFLDVDVVPTPSLLGRYADAAAEYPSSLLGGAVGYLPEGVDPFSPDRAGRAHFHAFRPRLQDGEILPGDPNLFWSLSFALTADAWQRCGGFYEGYSGYGGEDTDFARVAEGHGIDFRLVGGAEAFHQYHPSASPPVQHLDDILRNGRLFATRWGSWPMLGWLEEFESRGLVTHDSVSGDWQRAGARS